MSYLSGSWRRLVVRALVLVLALGAAPLNCLAGGPAGPPQPAPTLTASIQKAVQHEVGKVAKVRPNAARQAGASSAGEMSSGSFFKTPAGVLTIVLLAAGTGYALYSTSHDRVSSPNQAYGGSKK